MHESADKRGGEFVVEYLTSGLETLRANSREPGAVFGRRGILYGQRQQSLIWVVGFSTIGELPPEGLEPVGWYRFGESNQTKLTDADRAYFDDNFPTAGSLAAVVQSPLREAIVIGTYVRDGHRDSKGPISYHELVIEAPRSLWKGPVNSIVSSIRLPSSSLKRVAVSAAILLSAGAWLTYSSRMKSSQPSHSPAGLKPTQAPANPNFARLQELEQQKRLLEAELESRKTHDRRMEELVKVLRDRTPLE